MKVAVLTLPLWSNYGGILQAYALTKAIADLGHEVVFLDVRYSPKGRSRRLLRSLRRSLRRVVPGNQAPVYPDDRERAAISRHTRRFVECQIRPKTEHVSIDDAASVASKIDAIVVGSDQVWRREYMPDLNTYFLGSWGDSIIKISYAASLGVDDWRFSSTESQSFGCNLRQYRAVSVREDSAVALLERELGVHAARVCDPTLLFDSDHYRRLANLELPKLPAEMRIFTYVLDATPAGAGALAALVQSLGGRAVDVMPRPFDANYCSDDENYVFQPVEAWLRAFNECDFVVTDSFHGCVFSLIFNRPFVAVANLARGNTRLESLLRRFGLIDRLFPSLADIDPKSLAPIDWKEVNRKLEAERGTGISFLESALTPQAPA